MPNHQDVVLQSEKALFHRILSTVRRNDLLQLGDLHHANLIKPICVSRAFFLDPAPPAHYQKPTIQAEFDALPVRSESMDVVLCVHALERLSRCDEVMQEIHRVLKPDGKVIITGFNRWSLWRFLHYRSATRFYSRSRVKAALRDCGFQVELQETLCFWPSAKGRRRVFLETLGRLLWPIGGSVYMIAATKTIEGMTPLFEPAWIKKMPLEPSVRSYSCIKKQ